jgi:hypothetical protein
LCDGGVGVREERGWKSSNRFVKKARKETNSPPPTTGNHTAMNTLLLHTKHLRVAASRVAVCVLENLLRRSDGAKTAKNQAHALLLCRRTGVCGYQCSCCYSCGFVAVVVVVGFAAQREILCAVHVGQISAEMLFATTLLSLVITSACRWCGVCVAANTAVCVATLV